MASLSLNVWTNDDEIREFMRSVEALVPKSRDGISRRLHKRLCGLLKRGSALASRQDAVEIDTLSSCRLGLAFRVRPSRVCFEFRQALAEWRNAFDKCLKRRRA